MRTDGSWRLCDDGIVRPAVWGEVRGGDGSWVQALFLTDCAADRTVFSENVWRSLGLPGVTATDRLEGVDGAATSVVVDMQIRMARESGQTVLFKGQFAAFTDPAALDISVLGRDITNLFALIVDRPQDVVCLLGREHDDQEKGRSPLTQRTLYGKVQGRQTVACFGMILQESLP